MNRRIRAVISIAALMLVAAACGGDGAVGGPGESVTVKAVDYGYEDLPDTVVAGTNFVLENTSGAEIHEFVAVLLPEGEDRSVEELLKLPMEELAVLFPGVQTVLVATPNETGFPVEGTGVLDVPGRYAIICAIPTGADPAEFLAAAEASEGGPPEVDGGPPHFVQGMYAELTVVEE